MSRDYRLEYIRDHSSPLAKKARAMRNLWNRRLKGKVPEGFEIDHKIPLKSGGSNDKTNIRFRSISSNRSDKSMLKTSSYYLGSGLVKESGAVAAGIGAFAADKGVENKAKGAAAGAAASWLSTPLGLALGAEYIRRNPQKFDVSGKYFKPGIKGYSRILSNPRGYLKAIGPKGATAMLVSSSAVGYPSAYLAGKYFGRGNKHIQEKTAGVNLNSLAPVAELALDPRFQTGVMTAHGQIPDSVKNKVSSKIKNRSRQTKLSLLSLKRDIRRRFTEKKNS
jgi:hypothetical protein